MASRNAVKAVFARRPTSIFHKEGRRGNLSPVATSEVATYEPSQRKHPKEALLRKDGKGTKAVFPKADNPIWRLLDANANRAREGLRILEDTARFVLNYAEAAKALRQMRHALDALVREHYQRLLEHRHVETDSGRSNTAASYKDGIADLLAANCKRCEEALRVMEEYGRVLSARTVVQCQALRFQVYAWEKKLRIYHDAH